MNKLLISVVVIGFFSMVFADGAEVFKKFKCDMCHGKKAEKRLDGYSEVIAGWKAEKTLETLKGYKAKSINKYSFGTLMGERVAKMEESQMVEVAKYIESLGKKSNTKYAKEEDSDTLIYGKYIVKKGDTLSKISKKRYKNHYLWPVIYSLNSHILNNQDALQPGMSLLVAKRVDLKRAEDIEILTDSYIAAYKNYKKLGKKSEAIWLLYACYKKINPNILKDYKHEMTARDIKDLKDYIKRNSKK